MEISPREVGSLPGTATPARHVKIPVAMECDVIMHAREAVALPMQEVETPAVATVRAHGGSKKLAGFAHFTCHELTLADPASLEVASSSVRATTSAPQASWMIVSMLGDEASGIKRV